MNSGATHCVFIRQLPASVNKETLLEFLALKLHSPAYQDLASELNPEWYPLNFDVHLFKPRQRTRSALLILPHPTLASFFVQENNGSIYMNGYLLPICLDTQSNSINEMTIKLIQTTPWKTENTTVVVDPNDKVILRASTLQFGVECFDYVFSIEHEVISKEIQIQIDIQSRSILISKIYEIKEIEPSPLYYESLKPMGMKRVKSTMAIRNSSIAQLIRNDLDDSVILYLHQSPSYLKNDLNSITELFASLNLTSNLSGKELGLDKSIKKLSQSFDQLHEPIAPFTSHAIRIIFDDSKSKNTFLSMCKSIKVPKALELMVNFERRDLFSERNLSALKNWYELLPICISFQLDILIRNLVLNPVELLSLQMEINRLIKKFKPQECEEILKLFQIELFNEHNPDIDGQELLFHCLKQSVKNFKRKSKRKTDNIDQLYSCRHIIITPSQFHLSGPYLDASNRVFRMFSSYQDNFIKVSFTDESFLRLYFDKDVDRIDYLENRIGKILKDGVDLFGHHFEFLGYSNSALREHSTFFVAPFIDAKTNKLMNAESVRSVLGDFSKEIFYPARYGARLAQSFTSTRKSIKLSHSNLIEIPDVKKRDMVFTDGVGRISKRLAVKAWCAIESSNAFLTLNDIDSADEMIIQNFSVPSAFQFRLGGMKGMVSVDPTIKGIEFHWRDSMNKFSAPHLTDFEVVKVFDKPGKCTLNRPLIKILEDLGVPGEEFLTLQRNAVQATDNALNSTLSAYELLKSNGLGSSFQFGSLLLRLLNILSLDIGDLTNMANSNILTESLKYACYCVLRDLRSKTRIPVPGSYMLVGVADEWNYLRHGQVYVAIYDKATDETVYLEGPICISKSPSLHPGDVQMVYAIGKLPDHLCTGLKELKNVVVFSTDTIGDRPLPSCLGGGDLDGDEYILLVDPNLHPKRVVKPHHYPAATKYRLNRPCHIGDISNFVVNYFGSDLLGMICSRHQILSDIRILGTSDPDCIRLAEVASFAVDFPKSGTPVNFDELPKLSSNIKPDFMQTEIISSNDRITYYKSEKILGKLYRDITLTNPKTFKEGNQKPRRRKKKQFQKIVKESDKKMNTLHGITQTLLDLDIPDVELEYIQIDNIKTIDFINEMCTELSVIASLYPLTAYSEPLSEPELLIGCIIEDTSQPRKRSELTIRLNTHTCELYRIIHHHLTKGLSNIDIIYKSWDLWCTCSRQTKFGVQIVGYVALNCLLTAIDAIDYQVFHER